MALSEIIINDVVRFQTSTVISESSFQDLRQYLLERKALLTVTNTIDSILSVHYSADKQAMIYEQAKLACESQKLSDDREARADEEEKNSDALLRASYSQKLPNLENKKDLLDMQIYQQQNFHNQISSQVAEYKVNREQANRAIAQIQTERAMIMARYVVQPTFPQRTIHTPNGTIHTHTGTLHTHMGHMSSPPLYSIQDRFTLDSLAQQENRHNNERSRFASLIRIKEADLFREGQQLSVIVAEKRKIENRRNELMHQLNRELPQREQLRQIRAQNRVIRESARAVEDHELLQLSDENRTALTKLITVKIATLDKTRDGLMQKAKDCSYTVFVSQLEEVLSASTNQILTYNEREALKSIVSMMKQYSEMEKQEQITTRSLVDARSTLKNLQQKLGDSTRTLQSHEKANPQLKQTNRELTEDNRRLQLSSNSAGDARTDALYWSLFSGTATVVSTAIIGSLVVSPIFFAISGVLALATVISLTVATVYHFQKSDSDNKMDDNNRTILLNKATISQFDREAATLRTKTIPGLKTKVSKAQKLVELIDKELQEQQQEMKQLFIKAQNVIEFQSNPNGFFTKPATNVIPFNNPSQNPPQYEDAGLSFVMLPEETSSEQNPTSHWFSGYNRF